jgi:hypothetical protein
MPSFSFLLDHLCFLCLRPSTSVSSVTIVVVSSGDSTCPNITASSVPRILLWLSRWHHQREAATLSPLLLRLVQHLDVRQTRFLACWLRPFFFFLPPLHYFEQIKETLLSFVTFFVFWSALHTHTHTLKHTETHLPACAATTRERKRTNNKIATDVEERKMWASGFSCVWQFHLSALLFASPILTWTDECEHNSSYGFSGSVSVEVKGGGVREGLLRGPLCGCALGKDRRTYPRFGAGGFCLVAEVEGLR